MVDTTAHTMPSLPWVHWGEGGKPWGLRREVEEAGAVADTTKFKVKAPLPRPLPSTARHDPPGGAGRVQGITPGWAKADAEGATKNAPLAVPP